MGVRSVTAERGAEFLRHFGSRVAVCLVGTWELPGQEPLARVKEATLHHPSLVSSALGLWVVKAFSGQQLVPDCTVAAQLCLKLLGSIGRTRSARYWFPTEDSVVRLAP